MWFDARLTWNVHIEKMVNKCEKVLNVMICLMETEWGADRVALKAIWV